MTVQELYNRGEFDKVIRSLEKKPNIEFSHLLAFSYQKVGAWEKGMNQWNSLISIHPEKAEFYCERGVCKFNLRFKHAIQDFNKAIELEPSNAYFYSCRAFIKDKTGDSEGAVEDYKTAHDLDPEDAITLNNLGLAEQKLGYTARARERFKNSDDLMGIKTIDSREDFTVQEKKSTIWLELKKMVSSKEGFKSFLQEVGILKKN